MKRTIVLSAIVLVTGGCATGEYQRTEMGLDGYWDKQVAPGQYILEVYTIGGFESYEKQKNRIAGYFHRRAKELCPSGYSSNYRYVKAHEIYFAQFRCYARFCQNYPQLSGRVHCDREA